MVKKSGEQNFPPRAFHVAWCCSRAAQSSHVPSVEWKKHHNSTSETSECLSKRRVCCPCNFSVSVIGCRGWALPIGTIVSRAPPCCILACLSCLFSVLLVVRSDRIRGPGSSATCSQSTMIGRDCIAMLPGRTVHVPGSQTKLGRPAFSCLPTR
jgi:hypothetical protein